MPPRLWQEEACGPSWTHTYTYTHRPCRRERQWAGRQEGRDRLQHLGKGVMSTDTRRASKQASRPLWGGRSHPRGLELSSDQVGKCLVKRDEEPPERAPEKAWSLKTPTRKGRASAKKQEDNRPVARAQH